MMMMNMARVGVVLVVISHLLTIHTQNPMMGGMNQIGSPSNSNAAPANATSPPAAAASTVPNAPRGPAAMRQGANVPTGPAAGSGQPARYSTQGQARSKPY